jgi:hypothetical protein
VPGIEARGGAAVGSGQPRDAARQPAHAAHADQREWRVQHDARGARQRTFPERGEIRARRRLGRVIQLALGREHALCEARFLHVAAGAAHRSLDHRVAHQVLVALAPVHQQVVRIEMEAQVARYVGQPEDRGLQADQVPRVQQLVEAAHAGVRVAERLEAHAQAQAAVEAADDGPRRHAVRDERQAVESDKGQVGEGQRGRQAERHRLGHRLPLVAKQRCHHARLAMRGVRVNENLAHGGSNLESASSVMPSASA